MLEGFEDAQAACTICVIKGCCSTVQMETLTLTDVGLAAHESATSAVATVRGAVSAALPDEDCPT